MAIERFTLDDFIAALPPQAQNLGIDKGEYSFKLDLGRGKIIIRSSIDSSGIAMALGQNSIRVNLLDENGKPLTENVKDWTTREAGWQKRLRENLETMIGLY